MGKTYNVLTFAQRNRLIHDYLKPMCKDLGDGGLELPTKTITRMSVEATKTLGFYVTDSNISGAIRDLEEMGYTVVRRNSAGGKVATQALVEQLSAMEVRLQRLEQYIIQPVEQGEDPS